MSTNRKQRGLDALVELRPVIESVTEHQDKLDGARSEIQAMRARLDELEAKIESIEAAASNYVNDLTPVLEGVLTELTKAPNT